MHLSKGKELQLWDRHGFFPVCGYLVSPGETVLCSTGEQCSH